MLVSISGWDNQLGGDGLPRRCYVCEWAGDLDIGVRRVDGCIFVAKPNIVVEFHHLTSHRVFWQDWDRSVVWVIVRSVVRFYFCVICAFVLTKRR